MKQSEQKIKALQLKVDKITEKLKNDIHAICEQLDYIDSSVFSYNIDRLEQFNKGLQDFNLRQKC